MVQLNLSDIQHGKESTFGTEQTSYQSWPGLVSRGEVTPRIKEQELPIQTIDDRNEATQVLFGQSSYGIKVKMRLQNGRPFQWFMGGYGVAGSDPYTHSISLANTIPSYSIEYVYNSDHSHKFLGCKANTMTLTMTKGQAVICEVDFLAKSHSIDPTPGTPSKLATVPYEFHQATTFNINSVDYLAKTRQLQLTLNNGLEADYGISSRDPSTITEGIRKAILSCEIRADDETLIDLLKNRTDFAILLVITRGVNDTITITISNAKVFEPSFDLGSNAITDILPIRIIGDYTVSVVDSTVTYDN